MEAALTRERFDIRTVALTAGRSTRPYHLPSVRAAGATVLSVLSVALMLVALPLILGVRVTSTSSGLAVTLSSPPQSPGSQALTPAGEAVTVVAYGPGTLASSPLGPQLNGLTLRVPAEPGPFQALSLPAGSAAVVARPGAGIEVLPRSSLRTVIADG